MMMGLTSAPSSPLRSGMPRVPRQGEAMTSGTHPDTQACDHLVNAVRPTSLDAMFFKREFLQQLLPEALQSAVRATTLPTTFFSTVGGLHRLARCRRPGC